eukprot:CAMPEP_0172909246 /NCGR_PEP_ID=MMETSP1075-20121228/182276_1 /TAXON_ID=2916 /ORGANISM="Ceratium fusus, Strain PA161109" /LENGTH=192 /DNA_ID=CAMNT_0013767147 /DNA_START=26 /DNA_END=605 /DNA_ORIENTATION=+
MTFRFFKDPPPERQGTDPLAHKFGARDVPAEKSGKPGPPTPSSIASQIREVAAAQKRFREELEEVRNLANSNTHDLGVWKRSRGLEEPVTRQLGPSREHTTQSSAGRSVMSQTGNSKNGRPVLSWMGDNPMVLELQAKGPSQRVEPMAFTVLHGQQGFLSVTDGFLLATRWMSGELRTMVMKTSASAFAKFL